MKRFSDTTKQRMSDAAKRRCSPEWRKAQSERMSTLLPIELVRQMYEGGMSQVEIAVALNTTQKVIWRFMSKHGIKARVAAKRDQRASNNDSWKGNQAGYSGFHQRVEAVRGKPKQCKACGTSDPTLRYEWANLTGRYEDVNDYERMCVSCHHKFDKTYLNFTQTRPNKRKEINNARAA